MELAVREIAWARIQNLTGLALTIPILTMTIEAGTLALEQRLSFGNVIRSRLNRTLVGPRFSHLVRRNAGLKRVTLFGSDHRDRQQHQRCADSQELRKIPHQASSFVIKHRT